MKTNVCLLIDQSGSMEVHTKAVKELIRRFVWDNKGQENLLLSVGVFNDSDTPKYLYFQEHPSKLDAKNINYQPDGGTPLNKTLINVLDEYMTFANRDKSGRYIITVITDGDATDSSHADQLKQVMSACEGCNNLTVTAMVPKASSQATMLRLGLAEGNIKIWDVTGDFSEVESNLRTSFNSFIRSSDKKVTGFFTTNLTDKKLEKIKDKLSDVRLKFKTIKVDREAPIKPFVEEHGQQYVIGNAFYELTKTEQIQPNKEVLLRARDGKKVYGGEEARKILGLVSSGTIKVTPGNHQNFKIFVQSTSTNRKLVRGTELLYRLRA